MKVTRPDNLTYAINDVPPLPKLIFLGLQQVMVLSISGDGGHRRPCRRSPSVVAQSAVNLGMLALAITTVMQALWKGPLGSGYLAPPDRKSIAGGVLADGLGYSISGALGVVGISLLLGLTHETFPGFYQTLPSEFRLIADSILSIATISAVLLNLVSASASARPLQQ
jgi:xanthine permease XanP